MATDIVCPSCGRRLSLHQSLPPGSMVACPGCKTAFPLVTGGSSVDEANAEAVSERVLSRGARLDRLSHFDEEPARSDWGDEHDEFPALDRPRPRRRLGLRVAAAFLFLGIIAIIFLVLDTGTPVDVAGTWNGKFVFLPFDLPCTYEFHPDGTFVDEHVDPATGILGRFPGRYRISGAEVSIEWQNGGFERARVRATGPDAIEYTIVAHSDFNQVGAKATFVRVKR